MPYIPPHYDHVFASDVTIAEQSNNQPWTTATSAGLPQGGAACPTPAALQAHELDKKDVESLAKTFGGYIAPASYYTYDIDDEQVMEGAAGNAGNRNIGLFKWLRIGEKEAFAAVESAGEGNYFDTESSFWSASPQNLQRLTAVHEVAHKVVGGCASEVDRHEDELIAGLATVNAGGRPGLWLTLSLAALAESPDYAEIDSAVGQALSQSVAHFGIEVDSTQALAALKFYSEEAQEIGLKMEDAVANTGRSLGVKTSQLDAWERVLQDKVQSVMQSRVNEALNR
jgi:hypothetical protein